MESQFHTQPDLSVSKHARCPFHDGPATLDGLLAELDHHAHPEALDAALDLRTAFARREAADCVRLALRLRHTLDGSHYLAFYRVRQWLQRVIGIQIRAGRGAAWTTFPLPLNSARVDEIENACLAAWGADRDPAELDWAQLRFVFRTEHASDPVFAAPACVATAGTS
jgi:hypothetical protein